MYYPKKQPITMDNNSQDIFGGADGEVEVHIKKQQEQDAEMSLWLKRRDYDKIKTFLNENHQYTFGFDYTVSQNQEARNYRNASFTLGWHFPKDLDVSILCLKHHPDFAQTLKGIFYVYGPQASRQHLGLFLDNAQASKINILDAAGYYQWSLSQKKIDDKEYALVMNFFQRIGTNNDKFHLNLMLNNFDLSSELATLADVDPHQKNKFGSTFFHEAAYKWPENPENMTKWKQICDIFKKNPSFNPNIMSDGQYTGTVIHSLIFRKKLNFALEYVKTFSGNGLDLNLKNFKGCAPVHGLLRDSKDIMHVFASAENTLNSDQLALKSTVGELFLMMSKSGMDLELRSGKKGVGKTAKKIAAEKDGGSALLSIATENLLRELSERVRAEAGIDLSNPPKPKRKI